MTMIRAYGRAALFAATAATGMLLQQPAAQASDLVLRSNSPLARFLLPYSPYAFDLTVQVARSFAEVTYGQRSYDPITQNFVVSDLRIRRDAVDVSIRRLRIGEAVMMAEGVSLDTAGLPLPPPLRDGLRRLGREKVTGDLVAGLKRDDARSAFAVDLAMDMDGIGALSMQGGVDNFHILVPFPANEGELSQQPVVAGFLTQASFSYRDSGLATTVNEIVAEQQGVSPDEMRNGLAAMAVGSVDQLVGSLPGGASPELREQAAGWAKVVEAFIQKPDAIRVSFNPAKPFALSRLQDGTDDEEAITALNPDVVSGLAPPKTANAPAGPVEAAAALISGDAVVQDREGGARALLALAGGGDIAAVTKIVSLFGNDALPDLQPTELADLYKFLLVGRALGEPVSDGTLSSLGQALGPNTLVVTELAASAFFKGMTEAGRSAIALSADTIKQYNASSLRAMAYDAYEGRGVTRNLTEAYAIALVAAAAGDPLAILLRDNLAIAAREKRVVLSMDEAKKRAAELWTAYDAAGTTNP